MEVFQAMSIKLIVTTTVVLAAVCGANLVHAQAATMNVVPLAVTVSSATDLIQGYSETYVFKIGGKSIGEQSATLTKTENGLQTWTFSLNLAIPHNGQMISLIQSGTFVLDSEERAVSLDTTALVNGATQKEILNFADGEVNDSLDPPVAAIKNTFPLTGHPYLVIDNVITLISLAARANHAHLAQSPTMQAFSANAFLPLMMSFAPTVGAASTDGTSKPYVLTLTGQSIPTVTQDIMLSHATGEIVRLDDPSQGLEIVKQ
jgi:hypothetical protein